MSFRKFALTFAIAIVLLSTPFLIVAWLGDQQHSTTPEFFVGVEFAYGDENDLKDLVDKVKDYTNLFVIGSLDISVNQSLLNATCDYLYAAGLSFIVYFDGFTR